MATLRRFEDPQAWQKARELVREVYKTSAHGSLSRDVGLKDQRRRAAVSAMSNIAEGFARPSDRDFAHFLDSAKASVMEVQSLLYVAWDVGYIDQDVFGRLYQMTHDTAALIGGFTAYLRKKVPIQTPDGTTLD